ncbi:hypothetical protein [Bdellovibrio reynosensis]|uniref:Uncharacterized protein n=1 Tax=Bdellovibrio reynosensis TaxID=2835041 RepID=A0ABY4C9Q5_9BACT|nr:hypothetical protein [Bdellovibrio reynosensis]UOF01519.1 hypothetical protein MNR06_00945 [Bdellovibrio reynosensis]
MFTGTLHKTLSLYLALSLSPGITQAALNPADESIALKAYNFIVPGKRHEERCLILKPLPGMPQKVTKDEEDLCRANLYNSVSTNPAPKTYYSCPKVHNTSIAIESYKIPKGMGEIEFQKTVCPLSKAGKTKLKDAKDYPDKEVKFKFSSPGVSSGSMFGYYHVSNYLKAVDIPASVLRTVDTDTVLEHSLAGRYLSAVFKNSYLYRFYDMQTSLLLNLKHGSLSQIPSEYLGASHGLGIIPASFYNSTTRKLVSAPSYYQNRQLTDDRLTIYGPLSENPSNEASYSEISGTKPAKTRIEKFKTSSVHYPALKDFRPIEQILGSRDLAVAGQKMMGMQDTSSMLILDFLFENPDRIGNIHYKKKYFYRTSAGKVRDISQKKFQELSAKDLTTLTPEEQETLKAIQQTGVELKVMLLKDNDGGFDSNPFKKHQVIVDVKRSAASYDSWKDNADIFLNASMVVRHFNPDVYKGLVNLHGYVFSAQTKDAAKAYFTKGLQMTEGEYKDFSNNVLSIYRALYTNCKKNQLFLDLDTKNYFSANYKPILTTTPGVCEGQF